MSDQPITQRATTQQTIERLSTIVEHLLHGKLLHQVFDFRTINGNETGEDWISTPYGHCGTNGCALGEFPTIFPGQFMFDGGGVTGRNGLSKQEWLGISMQAYSRLFFSQTHRRPLEGCAYLPETATKEQVAANIQGHIDWLISHG